MMEYLVTGRRLRHRMATGIRGSDDRRLWRLWYGIYRRVGDTVALGLLTTVTAVDGSSSDGAAGAAVGLGA